MSRILNLFLSVFMVVTVVNSLFTRGPMMDSVSFGLYVEREYHNLSQDSFLQAPHLPFIFIHENNAGGVHHPNPGSPLVNFSGPGFWKKRDLKIFRPVSIIPFHRVVDLPIFLRVRSLRN